MKPNTCSYLFLFILIHLLWKTLLPQPKITPQNHLRLWLKVMILRWHSIDSVVILHSEIATSCIRCGMELESMHTSHVLYLESKPTFILPKHIFSFSITQNLLSNLYNRKQNILSHIIIITKLQANLKGRT